MYLYDSYAIKMSLDRFHATSYKTAHNLVFFPEEVVSVVRNDLFFSSLPTRSLESLGLSAQGYETQPRNLV